MIIKNPKPADVFDQSAANRFVALKMIDLSSLTKKLDDFVVSFDFEPKPSRLEALFLDPRNVGSTESMRDVFRDFNMAAMSSLAEINKQAKYQPELAAGMRKEFMAGMSKIQEWVKLCNMPEAARQGELQKLIDENAELIYSREFTMQGLSFTPIAIPAALLAMK